jgi:hypothetical protein
MGPVVGRGEESRCEVWEVALRISFSVEAFWSCSFRREFSALMVWVFFSRAASLASRSLTWRSLRSRKARWLEGVRWDFTKGGRM